MMNHLGDISAYGKWATVSLTGSILGKRLPNIKIPHFETVRVIFELSD